MIMKKYFIFAAVAAAGLFASCSSSDDVAANDAPTPQVTENEQVPILLGATSRVSADATKGTGSVGDIAGENTNVWAGQHVNVFMFNKGTFYLAGAYQKVVSTDGQNTVSYVATNEPALYNNQEMRTPNPGANTGADVTEYLTISDGTDPDDGKTFVQHKYYPMTNNFDFWAYHVDDAGTGTGNVGEPEYFDAQGAVVANPAAPNAAPVGVRVPFTIDGTQDLMVAAAWPSAAELSTPVGQNNDFYSAKAARANIQPNLTFNHLLTRLQFYLRGGNLKACGWVDEAPKDGTLDRAPQGTEVYGGVFVKEIKVYSKKSGNMVAAYNYWADASAKPAREVENLINWDYTGTYDDGVTAYIADNTSTNVVPFTLMGKKTTAASIVPTISPATHSEDAAAYTVPASVTEVADATALEAARSALTVDGDYYYYQVDNKTYYKVTVATNTPGAAVEEYTVPAGVVSVADAAALDAIQDAKTTTGDTWFYLEDTKEYILSHVTGAATPGAPYTPTSGTMGKLPALYDTNIFVDDDAWKAALVANSANYDKIYKANATAANAIEDVPVGAPMLVSTEANGYVMEITLGQYLLDKSVPTSGLEDGEQAGSADRYILKETKQRINIPAPTNAAKFEQSTSYNIVITAYSYEEINIKATLTGWIDGEDVGVVVE